MLTVLLAFQLPNPPVNPPSGDIAKIAGWIAQYGLWASAGIIVLSGGLWSFARFNPYVAGMHSGLRWMMTGLSTAFAIGLAGVVLTTLTNLWWS